MKDSGWYDKITKVFFLFIFYWFFGSMALYLLGGIFLWPEIMRFVESVYAVVLPTACLGVVVHFIHWWFWIRR